MNERSIIGILMNMCVKCRKFKIIVWSIIRIGDKCVDRILIELIIMITRNVQYCYLG